MVLADYPMSLVIALFAIVFSIFVFALTGFHTYIVSLGVTTQEKLKHVYDHFPRSPWSTGNLFRNWAKIVCCPRRSKTRLSYPLYLKTNEPNQFAALKDKLNEKPEDETILPEEMLETSVEIYMPAAMEPLENS